MDHDMEMLYTFLSIIAIISMSNSAWLCVWQNIFIQMH